MNVWQTQQAKQQFSALLSKALSDGPQYVSRHGRTVAVLVSLEEYEREAKPGLTLVEFLRGLPLEGVDLRRTQGEARPAVDLGPPP